MQFNEEKHIYYDKDGNEIPSVTHIIRIIAKNNLVKWANIMGFKHINTDKFVEHKAMLGTYFHKRVEMYYRGLDNKEIITEEDERKVDKMYEHFLNWDEGAKPKPIYMEKVFNNNKYGGKIDLLCEINGKIHLVDFKTSKSVFPTQFLQLGGYLNLINDVDKKIYDKIDFCDIIACNEKNIEIVCKSKDEMIKYEKAFSNIFLVYNIWKKILKDDWNEEIE